MAQLPSESLKIFVFQFSQHITLLTAKFSMAGLFQIYKNVNMTQQLEIQHSEKSERENNLIWELFIWHALIIMWVHECIYIYDDNLKSRNMALLEPQTTFSYYGRYEGGVSRLRLYYSTSILILAPATTT